MRKIVALVCSIALLSTSPALTIFADTDDETELYGDVNNDGYVSCKDIVYLGKMLLAFYDNNQNISNGDLNNDGFTNVLDMIHLKRMILGDTLISKVDTPVDIPVSSYSGQQNIGNVKSFTTREKYYNSSVFIKSYEQLLEFISSSSADGLNTSDLKERYPKDFFDTKSVVLTFNLNVNLTLVENATFFNNTLTINVFKCGGDNHNFLYVLYFPVVFNKDELRKYKIDNIQYKANAKGISSDTFDLQTYECCSPIDYNDTKDYRDNQAKYLVNENEIEEITDCLDVSEPDKKIILSKYNQEFFNNNKLIIFCAEKITRMTVEEDNKNVVFGLDMNSDDYGFSLLTIPKSCSDQKNITMLKWFCEGYEEIRLKTRI